MGNCLFSPQSEVCDSNQKLECKDCTSGVDSVRVGPPPLRAFSFHEIKNSTGNFRKGNLLGEGGAGKVYKGAFADWTGKLPAGEKRILAVKVLNVVENDVLPDMDWLYEVLLLGQLSHPNLVPLVGYSSQKFSKVLVYEFVENGTLDSWIRASPATSEDDKNSSVCDTPAERVKEEGARTEREKLAGVSGKDDPTEKTLKNLFGWRADPITYPAGMALRSGSGNSDPGSKMPPLSFSSRLSLALDMATAIGYLHSNNVIHRDLKSCNIMISKDFRAKIADFGMATRLCPEEGKPYVSTRVMGTKGYVDPKYVETGHLTQKSDVYAFGVILLELLTGRPHIFPNGISLTEWARPKLLLMQEGISNKREEKERSLEGLLDPKLKEGEFDIAAALKLAVLARFCLLGNPDSRPSMCEIERALKSIASPGSGADALNNDSS